MEEIKNLQGMRTVYDANDVDSLDDNNEEMLRGAGSSGSGSGNGGGSEEEGSIIEIKYGLLAGSARIRPMGLPVIVEIEITWGSGNFNGITEPNLSAEFKVTGSNSEYEFCLDHSNLISRWQCNYGAKIEGKFVYKFTHKPINNSNVVVQTNEVIINTLYYIPDQYRDC